MTWHLVNFDPITVYPSWKVNLDARMRRKHDYYASLPDGLSRPEFDRLNADHERVLSVRRERVMYGLMIVAAILLILLGKVLA